MLVALPWCPTLSTSARSARDRARAATSSPASASPVSRKRTRPYRTSTTVLASFGSASDAVHAESGARNRTRTPSTTSESPGCTRRHATPAARPLERRADTIVAAGDEAGSQYSRGSSAAHRRTRRRRRGRACGCESTNAATRPPRRRRYGMTAGAGVAAAPAAARVEQHPAPARRPQRERVALPDVDHVQLDDAATARHVGDRATSDGRARRRRRAPPTRCRPRLLHSDDERRRDTPSKHRRRQRGRDRRPRRYGTRVADAARRCRRAEQRRAPRRRRTRATRRSGASTSARNSVGCSTAKIGAGGEIRERRDEAHPAEVHATSGARHDATRACDAIRSRATARRHPSTPLGEHAVARACPPAMSAAMPATLSW